MTNPCMLSMAFVMQQGAVPETLTQVVRSLPLGHIVGQPASFSCFGDGYLQVQVQVEQGLVRVLFMGASALLSSSSSIPFLFCWLICHISNKSRVQLFARVSLLRTYTLRPCRLLRLIACLRYDGNAC